MPLTVGVFISHSFHDHDHLSSVDTFRESIRSCCEEIKVEPTSDQPTFDLYFEDATFGKPLANAIRAEIARRDIFLVDISGGSANVFYELGFAHGWPEQCPGWAPEFQDLMSSPVGLGCSGIPKDTVAR